MPKLTSAKSTLLLCLLLFSIASFSQKKITGKVTDVQLKPLSGTTIAAKGSNIAVVTSDDGAFSITVPDKSNTLEVSNVGFETKEVSILGITNVMVALNAKTTALNEVVVIGYGTQKRKDLTGSISSVSAATIEKVPVINATQALQGRAAGVQIMNNDASPGGNISILIRGIGSLASGGNDPLYVIDGYPTGGGINNINPNDIASIDVLKDASATAVYGIRAANGVV
ncbi:MAG: TonB-dependent receptor plug domain-containing protein, partial [Ferruginibacter sp.]